MLRLESCGLLIKPIQLFMPLICLCLQQFMRNGWPQWWSLDKSKQVQVWANVLFISSNYLRNSGFICKPRLQEFYLISRNLTCEKQLNTNFAMWDVAQKWLHEHNPANRRFDSPFGDLCSSHVLVACLVPRQRRSSQCAVGPVLLSYKLGSTPIDGDVCNYRLRYDLWHFCLGYCSYLALGHKSPQQ